jgi:hypothetical protein
MTRAKRLDMASDRWTTDELAEFFRLTPRYIREKFVFKNGFPKPISDKTSRKKWDAAQVKAWDRGGKQ